jgi:hypothetical protein
MLTRWGLLRCANFNIDVFVALNLKPTVQRQHIALAKKDMSHD